MKTALTISVFLNCAFLGCLALLLLSQRRASNGDTVPGGATDSPLIPETRMPTPVASPVPAAKGLQWSQVESPDYRTYVANLRAIGCPEQTIRDIITADVDSLYAGRRRPLEGQLTARSHAARIAAETALRGLRDEEAATIAALLPLPSADVGVTDAAAARVSPAAACAQQHSDTVRLPLVFQEVDTSALTLSARQSQVINDLRSRFIESIGGTNQDPKDPAYLERWLTSQPAIDDDLRGMIGVNAYQDYQLAAKATAQAQTPSEP